MATDATGTPTSPDNIPTFNTSVDAPSGLGSNAQMAAIQTALTARVSKPAGILSGEAAVWNGSGWDRSSVTRIGPSSLGSGSPSSANFLRGDGTWVAVAGTTYRVGLKTVNTTVAATDLFSGVGGPITVGANVMGATGVLRIRAWGDYLQNSGGLASGPRFQLVLGGTTVLDTNTTTNITASAGRQSWRMDALIKNDTAASQTAELIAHIYAGAGIAAGQSSFATGTGGGTPTANGWAAWGVNSGLALDTTTSKTLVLNVINGSASATYETKLFGALVEVI